MLAMTGATAGFAVNDAMMKLLVAHLPVSQLMVERGLIVAALAAAVSSFWVPPRK